MTFDQSWQDRAACRGVPVEHFFPLVEQDCEVAKEVCAGCEVRTPCLEFALTSGETFGVWGGLTTQERRALIARRKRQAAVARRVDRVLPPV